MVALATKLFDLIPAPVAAVLMLGGFIFYALGLRPAGLWRSGKAAGAGPHRAGRAGDPGDKARRRA